MLKREILLTSCAIVLALSGQEAKAAEACTATPTCEELGYTQTRCDGFISLTCPFDKTKMFCGTYCVSGYYKLDRPFSSSVLGSKCVKPFPYGCGAVYNSDDGAPTVAVALSDEGNMTWAEARAACAAKTTCGKSWHLPTSREGDMFLRNSEQMDRISIASEYRHGQRLYYDGTYYWIDGGNNIPCVYELGLGVDCIDNDTTNTMKLPVRCVFTPGR